jgi:hypothetical protein
MVVDFEVFGGRYFSVATRLNEHGLDFDLAIWNSEDLVFLGSTMLFLLVIKRSELVESVHCREKPNVHVYSVN